MKVKFETYVIINGLAYSLSRMPWYKRIYYRVMSKLGRIK